MSWYETYACKCRLEYLICCQRLMRNNVSWYGTCACKCRLDASVCNDRKPWNNDKCRGDCRELIDKGKCNDGNIWNLSTCECEWDKSYDVGEDLDYVNCKCSKRLIDKLVEKCDEDIDGNKMVYNAALYDYKKLYRSCIWYVVLLIIVCIMNGGITCVFLFILA